MVLGNLEAEPPRRGSHAPEVLSLEPVPEGQAAEHGDGCGVCGNCGKRVPAANLASHTVHCYRHVSKCDHCGELVPRNEVEEHRLKWTDPEALHAAALAGDEATV